MIRTGRTEKNGRPEWRATLAEKAIMRTRLSVELGAMQAVDAATQYACPFCAKHECPGQSTGAFYSCPQTPDDALAEGPSRAVEGLIWEGSNFDFDCPDEYDPETGEEGEDGSALDRLYEETCAFLRGAK